ncbi:MAG: 4Fe-4S dicluster domain-containing protein [Tetrasphaera sp.]
MPRVVDATRLPVDRRALLGAPPAGREFDPRPPTPTPTDHARLIAALRRLLPAVPVNLAEGPAPGIRLRVLPHSGPGGSPSAGCTACLTCVRTCPESALEMPVTGEVARLREHPARCSGCRACLAACPEGVLVVDRQLRWSDQLGADAAYPLIAVETAVCARCGARFPAAAGRHCAVCAFRIAHPFGSQLPPAADAVRRRALSREAGTDAT